VTVHFNLHFVIFAFISPVGSRVYVL